MADEHFNYISDWADRMHKEIDKYHEPDYDGPTLGDILNIAKADIAAGRIPKENKVSTIFPITTDPVLVSNLRWAIEENRKVEGIKTLRALIKYEVMNQAPEARISLSLCAEIWDAFADAATFHKHHLKDDAADYDAKLTPAECAAYDAGYNACAEEERLTFESNPQSAEEQEEPVDSTEYDVIVWSDIKPSVHRYWDKQEAYEAAKEEHRINKCNTVYVARIIAQPYSTVEMEEM